MIPAAARATRAVRIWLRGVRARLVAVYVLVAALVALAGVFVFGLLLSGTLTNNVDADLQATSQAFAADIRGHSVERTDPAPTIDLPRAHRDLPAVVAIYAPGGMLVDAEPAVLPADPGRIVTRSGLSTVRYDGRTFRVLRDSVRVGSGTWVVVVGQSLSATTDANSDARHVLYTIVPIAVVLSGVGAWLLSGAALRPVDRMRADAQRLSETGAAGGIGVPPSADSLSKLAQTFNVLLHRLHASVERQRDFVAYAGHELRTPLAVLQTELETAIRPGRTRADLEDSIRHARGEAARLAGLAEDLLLLAQADGSGALVRPELVEPVDAVIVAADAHRAEFREAGVELVVPDRAARSSVVAELDPVALRRILDNLLVNAARHTPAGGTVTVEVAQTDRELQIGVRDTGEGFPDDFLPHAFERFARADRSRTRSSAAAGSGLGLSIVATLVEAHGGSVTAHNVAPHGARVLARFPMARDGSCLD